MKGLFFFFPLLFLSFLTAGLMLPPDESWREKVAPAVLDRAEAGEEVDFLVILAEQADLSDARREQTKEGKGRFVFEKLRALAGRTQAPVRALLEEEAVPYRSFYLVNALYARAGLDVIRQLAGRSDVREIQADPQVRLEDPFPDRGGGGDRNGVEWGVGRIQAPEVWALGYTGQGVVIGGQDTGYEWDHPALKSQYRGWNGSSVDHHYNWHDAIHAISPLHNDSIVSPGLNPCGLDSPVPCDDHNHGTHTMGTMIGDDGAGNQIGVAPGARWIGCRNMERGWGSPASYIECFQWFLAPTDLNDENPDPGRAPHVINNSWSCPEIEGCNESNWATMEAVIDNLKAAGILVVVSAGNSGGNGCGSVSRPPAIFANSFAVGALRQNDTIASFSSRGPVTVDGSGRLKPDVAAPGVGVRSSVRGGDYASFSGTSMAGPHVAGLAALVISANPALAGQVETIEAIIEQAALPRTYWEDCGPFSGAAVPNPAYGHGQVNALAAVQEALALTGIREADAEHFRLTVSPNPFRDGFVLEGVLPAGDVALEVFDPNGRRLWSEKIRHPGGTLQQTVTIPGSAPGILFYRLRSGALVHTGRLLRQ